MKNLTYCQRLSELQLDSLELRRVRLDLTYAYKILLGLVEINLYDTFQLRTNTTSRGHKYKLSQRTSSTNSRHNFFVNRVTRIWNSLPVDTTDFSNLSHFVSSLGSAELAKHCKVYFLKVEICIDSW